MKHYVKFGWINNVITKHVKESGHKIDWEKANLFREGTKKVKSEKDLGNLPYRKKKKTIMNCNKSSFVSAHCAKGLSERGGKKVGEVKRERRRDCHMCQTSVYPEK